MPRTIEEFRKQSKHIKILNHFYSNLVGALDYKKVASLAVNALMKYSNSPSVAVFEYDKIDNDLKQISSKGFMSEVLKASKSFKVNDSFTGLVVKTKKVSVLKDLKINKHINESARIALLNAGFSCVVSIPLLYGSKVFGAANLIFKEKDGVKDVDRETLIAIGKTIALALVNAKYVGAIKTEISKRNKAEKELKQNAMNYKSLVENLNDMIVKFDTKGKLLFVSPNYCRLFDVDCNKIVGKKFLPLIHPGDLLRVQKILEKALKPPYECEHEERMLTKDGWRWIQWSNKAVATGDTGACEIIAIGRDITERKETELALIQSENNLKSILEAIPDLMFRVNTSGVYLDYVVPNDSNLKIPKELVVNKNMIETLPREVYNIAKQKIKRVIRTGKAETMEYSMPHQDQTHHFEGRIVKSGNDEVLVIVRDITDTKNYREEINKLALIARETDNGVIITDANDLTEWVNEGFTRITGYQLSEIKNQKPGELLLGEESDPEIIRQFGEALHSGKRIRAEIINYHKSGKKYWVDLNAQPVFDKDGKIRQFIYMQNVTTQRKEYELMLKEKQERLSQLTRHLIERREIERADIARGIHDELGQIVAAVKMNLSFLINNLSSSQQELSHIDLLEELKAMSQMIDNSVVSIRRLIKNLRPETLDKLGLIPAVKQLLDDFKSLTKINYRFGKNFDELEMEDAKITAVYRTVQESLTNIIKHSNATKVNVEMKISGAALDVKVSDNGKGIKNTDLEKSTSFGLFGMRQRIEGLGGAFRITGKEGAGTKLFIKLPVDSHHF